MNKGYCYTPLGNIKAENFNNGEKVKIIIRPEGLKLNKQPSPILSDINGIVVDSKFIGTHAIIHLTVSDNLGKKFHIHSKVSGDFLPSAASSVSIDIDSKYVFIFSRN